MPTLAPKLPYTHPFAGGYPRVGGQPLPTDPDAIDYLERVAAADGAAVEVGVAMAVDAFVRGCKADGIWNAIKASCIMCGARTIAGALVPLVGTAPTPYNFVAADYDRSGGGLKGDGSTKYLDSNRANNADGKDDQHLAVYVTEAGTRALIGAGLAETGTTSIFASTAVSMLMRNRNGDFDTVAASNGGIGMVAMSRASASTYTTAATGNFGSEARSSETPYSANVFVFGRSGVTLSAATSRLAFYSIGSAIPDLAALDARVSTLVAAIAAAL